MHGVVKIHGLDTIYYLPELPDEGSDWEIEEGAWVEVGPDVDDNPNGSDRPASWTLAISKDDPKHYRLFKYPEGVENAGFELTGRSYGGIYSRSMWERLAEAIPSMRAFEAIGGNDRPGAMDEAMRYIRGARLTSVPLVTSPEPEPCYFHFSATLRVFGVIPNLDEITKTLGLTPTDTHRRGDRKGPRSHGFEHDMWSYTPPVPEDRPLDVHIQTLWTHIQPHRMYLMQLKERLTVDVFCGYRSNSGIAGFEVSHHSLELFRQLEIPFGVSVIIA